MLGKKVVLAVLLALALCLTFTSCQASNKGDYAPEDSIVPSDPNYGYGDVEKPEANLPTTDITDDALQQKIIRTVYMDAQTKQFDAAISSVRSALKTAGGFEETFRTTNRSYGSTDYYARNAHMVLRIPAEKLDGFLNEIGGMIHVTSQNSNVSNVTSEYYDIEARLNVLEGERAVYEKMLTNAKTTSEMLSIQDRLYDVISEIEAFKTRLRVLDSQVAYSTVTINLSEVVEYTNVTTAETGFGERIKNAFAETWQNFVKAMQTLLIALIYALPALVFLAVAGLIAIIIVVIVKKRKKKKATFFNNMQMPPMNQINQ